MPQKYTPKLLQMGSLNFPSAHTPCSPSWVTDSMVAGCWDRMWPCSWTLGQHPWGRSYFFFIGLEQLEPCVAVTGFGAVILLSKWKFSSWLLPVSVPWKRLSGREKKYSRCGKLQIRLLLQWAIEKKKKGLEQEGFANAFSIFSCFSYFIESTISCLFVFIFPFGSGTDLSKYSPVLKLWKCQWIGSSCRFVFVFLRVLSWKYNHLYFTIGANLHSDGSFFLVMALFYNATYMSTKGHLFNFSF